MNPEKHRLVEQRAYALWQAEGQPHGKHEEHWRQAICEVEAEEGAGPTQKRGAKRSAPRDAPRSRTPSVQERKRAKG